MSKKITEIAQYVFLGPTVEGVRAEARRLVEVNNKSGKEDPGVLYLDAVESQKNFEIIIRVLVVALAALLEYVMPSLLDVTSRESIISLLDLIVVMAAVEQVVVVGYLWLITVPQAKRSR